MKKAFRLLFPVFLVIILYMISLSSVFADIKKHSTFAQATVKQAEITAFLLNVRTGPDTSYPVISRLRKGQIVNVLGKLNDWYVVHLPDDSVGVISSKYTKPYSYNENVLNNIENNQIVTTSSNDTVSIQEKEKIMLEYINNERKKWVLVLIFSMIPFLKLLQSKQKI
ncbi:MAG TPA: SH3 domain-containing protein, partial [Defluviitaleaceae bacterium]|nr:SH3 domain-containing protein [Defluviitaleaceae bacterium]